jgi:hypothetical protein
MFLSFFGDCGYLKKLVPIGNICASILCTSHIYNTSVRFCEFRAVNNYTARQERPQHFISNWISYQIQSASKYFQHPIYFYTSTTWSHCENNRTVRMEVEVESCCGSSYTVHVFTPVQNPLTTKLPQLQSSDIMCVMHQYTIIENNVSSRAVMHLKNNPKCSGDRLSGLCSFVVSFSLSEQIDRGHFPPQASFKIIPSFLIWHGVSKWPKKEKTNRNKIRICIEGVR